jgi:Skp family chaperone for outer membrane proteins
MFNFIRDIRIINEQKAISAALEKEIQESDERIKNLKEEIKTLKAKIKKSPLLTYIAKEKGINLDD